MLAILRRHLILTLYISVATSVTLVHYPPRTEYYPYYLFSIHFKIIGHSRGFSLFHIIYHFNKSRKKHQLFFQL